MKLAVVGSRSFSDYGFGVSKLNLYLEDYNINKNDLIIISGGAAGADSFAEFYARTNGLILITIYPKWAQYGKLAGIKRNKIIVDLADEALIFFDGISKGTANTIELIKKKGIRHNIVLFK